MKARILVAVVAIPLLFLAIVFLPVWALGIIAGVIAAFCAWEFLRCTEEKASPRILAYAAVSAFCIPFLSAFYASGPVISTVLLALFAALFIELMLSFRKGTTMEFETVTAALMAGGVMPVLLAAMVRIGRTEGGAAAALLPFLAAFASDIGAFFCGIFLGNHKLSPHISPNKTVEGSAGGFAGAVIVMLLYGLVLRALGYHVDFAVIGVYGFFGSLAAQLGDLSFSAVKRLFRVKDYGELLPGHGGMLDRFDSMVWTAPVIELLVLCVPAIYR